MEERERKEGRMRREKEINRTEKEGKKEERRNERRQRRLGRGKWKKKEGRIGGGGQKKKKKGENNIGHGCDLPNHRHLLQQQAFLHIPFFLPFLRRTARNDRHQER